MNNLILDELAAIEPLDAIEAAHLADAVAWVESDAQLFRIAKPATPSKHLVSYFAVVDDDHILLVDHRNAGLWLPTGGHVEPGEHPRETVVRELFEELGLLAAVDAIGPPAMVTVTVTTGQTAGHTDVSLWYVVRGNRSAAFAFDTAEFSAARWFAFAEAPLRRADPHLGRFIAKIRRVEAGLTLAPTAL